MNLLHEQIAIDSNEDRSIIAFVLIVQGLDTEERLFFQVLNSHTGERLLHIERPSAKDSPLLSCLLINGHFAIFTYGNRMLCFEINSKKLFEYVLTTELEDNIAGAYLLSFTEEPSYYEASFLELPLSTKSIHSVQFEKDGKLVRFQ